MLSERVICYGSEAPLPTRQLLRAGPLTLFWEDGDLRYVRLGDKEVLRRVYVAIRDRNWGTAQNTLSNFQMMVGQDAFGITFDVENRLGDIHFTWRGKVTGTADGVVRYVLEGTAQTTFLKNRIGFCVLHPDDIAGAAARVSHVDDALEDGQFPVRFIPDQPVLPFAEMRGMAHEVKPGVWAELAFAGDIFEMEDQRNWTDASFKTFSTPLRIPFPVEVPAGTRIYQALTLSLRGESEVATLGDVAAREEVITFAIDSTDAGLPVPALGLGVASHGQTLTAEESKRLEVLAPAHLRVDLVLSDPQFPARLAQAAREADALGAGLEIALFVSPDRAEAEVRGLRETLHGVPANIVRWLVFPIAESFRGGTPLREVLVPARAALSQYDAAPLFSGTNTDFIFLARNVPPAELVDGLTFAITAQVHAFDNASLVETLSTQGQAVANARALASGKPVVVSPITLKMRHNPYATGAIAPTPPGELPSQVDPRQMSLLAAGWTVGSLRYVAEARAAAVTFFETTGWRGVMERVAGSGMPDKFPSLPGCVFPLYHVLADVTQFRAGVVIPSRSSDRLTVDGIALADGETIRVIIANMSGEPQAVTVTGLTGKVALHLLDATNAEAAMRSPERFREAAPAQHWDEAANLVLLLSPYAVARLDGRRSPDALTTRIS